MPESLRLSEANATAPGETMASDGGAADHAGQAMSRDGLPALPLPESSFLSELLLQVEFNNGMWRTMPLALCTDILQQWHGGAQEVSFVWDWKDTRKGSYERRGAKLPVTIATSSTPPRRSSETFTTSALAQ